MTPDMHLHPESDRDMRRKIIADAFATRLPTMARTIVFVTTAFAALSEISENWLMSLVVAGLLVSAARIFTTMAGRRVMAGDVSKAEIAQLEYLLAFCYLSFSAIVGLFAARVVWIGPVGMQSAVLVMVMGYSAGIVACGASMLRTSLVSLCFTAGPAIVACLASGVTTQQLTGFLIAAFLIGALRVIKERHRSRKNEIALQMRDYMLAHRDHLTGLSNRLGMVAEFDALLANSEPEQCISAYCLDLDGFKPINDRFGHGVGDEALRIVATKLRESTPDESIVARVGGDEFIVVCANFETPASVATFAQRLQDTLTISMSVEQDEIYLSSSIGFAMSERRCANLELLHVEADASLLAQKDRRRKADGRSSSELNLIGRRTDKPPLTGAAA